MTASRSPAKSVPVAADVALALDANPVARHSFYALPHSHRNEHLRYIDEAKRPETRARRIASTITSLAAPMMPPVTTRMGERDG
jgi:uncharacterized protein YdeI (YjbR/CyaY-like superfamily)